MTSTAKTGHTGLLFFAAVLTVAAFVRPAEARTWTCHATITLTGSNFSYSVSPWRMSGGGDRENHCLRDLKTNWLDNGAIWQQLRVPRQEQKQYCHSGAQFLAVYGFDRRRKAWSYTSRPLYPACTNDQFNH